MTLVRWDPLQLMRWPNMWDEEDNLSTSTNTTLDVYETDNEVVVRANVAGISEDKVDITFEKGILWIRGEEVAEEKQDDKKYYHKASRSYSYKIAVPGNIDMRTEPDAEVENGVVRVVFKKAEEAKPKRIAVKSKTK
jgi:HSP20 family protein